MERILGKIEGELPGPLIFCIAGLHGNEQIGLHAFNNVYHAIQKHNIPLRGKLVGIAGNIKAIQSNRRFIDYDLNRCWTDDIVEQITKQGVFDAAEDEELVEIHRIIEQESAGNYTMKVIADLHSTSSDKGSFIVIPEVLGEHPIVHALHLPVALDLHMHLHGTLLDYYAERGYISFAFEGGLIGSSMVYQIHTSGIWEILDSAGAITHHDHEQEDHYAQQLENLSKELPGKVKVVYRHSITPVDGFRMLPGYANFQPVKMGQTLAFDAGGEVKAPMDGYIFMPLYQEEGEDGFFIVQEVG